MADMPAAQLLFKTGASAARDTRHHSGAGKTEGCVITAGGLTTWRNLRAGSDVLTIPLLSCFRAALATLLARHQNTPTVSLVARCACVCGLQTGRAWWPR